jgi:hypothetical protein
MRSAITPKSGARVTHIGVGSECNALTSVKFHVQGCKALPWNFAALTGKIPGDSPFISFCLGVRWQREAGWLACVVRLLTVIPKTGWVPWSSCLNLPPHHSRHDETSTLCGVNTLFPEISNTTVIARSVESSAVKPRIVVSVGGPQKELWIRVSDIFGNDRSRIQCIW